MTSQHTQTSDERRATSDAFAPAKINLGLHILRRRADGYHDLETVFLRIGWADRVSVRPADTFVLTCTDPRLPTDETNLCMKAARLLADHTGVEAGATIHLEKHVPFGAGLGGGSSDAAATLRLLCDLWNLDLPEVDLHALAAELGSDVPFFLGPPVAYATGRGEQLEPLPDYQLPYDLLVVKPPVSVSTAEAYQNVRPSDHDRPDLRKLVASNDLTQWRTHLVNDFEVSVFSAYPVVKEVRDALLDAGAAYAGLSGSGSAVFGIFEDAAALQRAFDWSSTLQYRTFSSR